MNYPSNFIGPIPPRLKVTTLPPQPSLHVVQAQPKQTVKVTSPPLTEKQKREAEEIAQRSKKPSFGQFVKQGVKKAGSAVFELSKKPQKRLQELGDPLVELAEGKPERLKQNVKNFFTIGRDDADRIDPKTFASLPKEEKTRILDKYTNIALMLNLDAGLRPPTIPKPPKGKGGFSSKAARETYEDLVKNPSGEQPGLKVNQYKTNEPGTAVPKSLRQSEQLPKTPVEAAGFQKRVAIGPKPVMPEPRGPAGSPEIGRDVSYKPTVPPKPNLGKSATDEITYNIDRLKISPKAKADMRAEIQNAAEHAKEVVGKKLSNNEVIDLANNTTRTLNRTVKREDTARKIASNLNLRRKIADVAQSGKIDPDFIDLWMKDKAAGEDIARQLQARRIVADPEEAKTIDTILDSIYKVNKNADEVAQAARGVDFNDPKQLTEFYRKFVKPKAGDWIDLLRYNSMLSSPNTHMVNASSNFQGSAIIAPIEKTVTGMLDATRAALTGGERHYAVGEGGAYLKGYVKSVRKAFTSFVDVLRNRSLSQNPDVRSIPLATSKTGKIVEGVLNPPMKLLEATDQFFTALAKGGEIEALNYRAGRGISVGRNLEGQASKAAAKRLFRSDLNLPEQGYVLNAIDELTGKIEMLRHSKNPIVATVSKFTLPFIRTPMNIFKQGVEYSPMGLLTLPGASNKTEQLAKVIIGTGSALAASTLLGQDRLTWAEPTNATEKAKFREAGRQPYSVKIGNKWYSYSKLHPAIAFNFALISAIDDSMKNRKLSDDQADTILTTFAKVANFFADQSYMKSIGDFVAGAKGDAYGFAQQLANYPTQLVPYRAMLSFIERMVDPVQRQADPKGTLLEKQMQYAMAQIPGLAQNVPPRLGPSGNPIPNEGAQGNLLERLGKGLNPIRTTTENPAGEEFYQQSLGLKKLEQRVKAERDVKKQKAQQIYDQIKDLSKEERKARILEMKKNGEIDDYTEAKYKEIVRVEKLGLSPWEAELKGATVDARVEILYEKMKSMSKDERTAYRKELKDKKILSDEVDAKLRKLFKSN